jgi:hypothetical protein
MSGSCLLQHTMMSYLLARVPVGSCIIYDRQVDTTCQLPTRPGPQLGPVCWPCQRMGHFIQHQLASIQRAGELRRACMPDGGVARGSHHQVAGTLLFSSPSVPHA